MSFYRTFAIVIRQFYLIRSSFSRVFPLFAWAAVDVILWGFLTRYLNTFAPAGFNFVPALPPAFYDNTITTAFPCKIVNMARYDSMVAVVSLNNPSTCVIWANVFGASTGMTPSTATSCGAAGTLIRSLAGRTGCGLCAQVCPDLAITVFKEEKK